MTSVMSSSGARGLPGLQNRGVIVKFTRLFRF